MADDDPWGVKGGDTSTPDPWGVAEPETVLGDATKLAQGAIAPITSLPETHRELTRQYAGMLRDVGRDIVTPHPEEGVLGNIGRAAANVGKGAYGAWGLTWSPVEAGLRSIAGRPVTQVAGPVAGATAETALGAFLPGGPGMALTRRAMGIRPPIPGAALAPGKAPTGPVADALQRAQNTLEQEVPAPARPPNTPAGVRPVDMGPVSMDQLARDIGVQDIGAQPATRSNTMGPVPVRPPPETAPPAAPAPAQTAPAVGAQAVGDPLQGISPETRAHLRKIVESELVSPHYAEQLAAEAPRELMLGEMTPNLQTATRALGSAGEEATTIANAVTERAREARGRINTYLDNAFGAYPPAGRIAAERALVNQAQTQSRPFWRVFDNTAITPTPQLIDVTQRLRDTGMLSRAESLLRAEGKPTGFTWLDEAGGSQRLPTAPAYQKANEALGAEIARAKREGDGPQARAYTILKKDLTEAIDNHPNQEIGNVWRQARETYATPMRVQSAIDLGRNMFKTAGKDAIHPEELAGRLASVTTPAEREGFNLGMRSYFRDKFGAKSTTATTRQAMEDVLSNDSREKLAQALGEERATNLITGMEHERRMHEAPTHLIYGSQTTPTRVAREMYWEPKPGMLDAAPEMVGHAAHVIAHPPTGLTGVALRAAAKFGKGRLSEKALANQAKINRESARILTLQGRERDAAIQALFGYRMGTIGRGVQRARGGKVPSPMEARREYHYRDDRGTGQRKCENCTMFRVPHSCTDVGGFIARKGLCDIFKAARADGGRIDPADEAADARNVAAYRLQEITRHGEDVGGYGTYLKSGAPDDVFMKAGRIPHVGEFSSGIRPSTNIETRKQMAPLLSQEDMAGNIIGALASPAHRQLKRDQAENQDFGEVLMPARADGGQVDDDQPAKAGSDAPAQPVGGDTDAPSVRVASLTTPSQPFQYSGEPAPPADQTMPAQMRPTGGTVGSAIDSAAKQYGLNPVTLRGIASIESSWNPDSNRNRPTQYKGLFQIGSNEWRQYGQGNIYNAQDNANAAAKMLADHAAWFGQKYGREPTPGELYMMHLQGRGFYQNGTMTNVVGNPYPGMRGPQTPQSFEAGWSAELARRMKNYGGADSVPVTSVASSTASPSSGRQGGQGGYSGPLAQYMPAGVRSTLGSLGEAAGPALAALRPSEETQTPMHTAEAQSVLPEQTAAMSPLARMALGYEPAPVRQRRGRLPHIIELGRG